MARNTSVSLGEPFTEYIETAVKSGAYGSASEVIRDAMRMKMEHDERLKTLRKAIQAGIDSGPAQRIDPEKKLQKLKQRPRRSTGFDPQVVGPYNGA